MKRCIKKIAYIILGLSIILTFMNIGSFVSYAESTDSDFSYYYVGAESDVKTCSAAEINDVIEGATGDMVIEVNRDVTLPEDIFLEKVVTRPAIGPFPEEYVYREYRMGAHFNKPYNYTLNLNDHSLTVEDGARVILVNNEANVTIKNGTITGANVNSTPKTTEALSALVHGAGINSTNATINIENVKITNNKGGYGGAIYASESTVDIKNSEFSNNTGTTNGGGIFFDKSTVTLVDCVISDNTLSGTGSSVFGAGIYATAADITATNIKIINNGSENVKGAGIQITGDSTTTITDSLIANNYATGSKASNYGAGLAIRGGNITLNNTVIRNNEGYENGGVSLTSSSSPIVFQMNSGAIYNNTATVEYETGLYAHNLLVNKGSFIDKVSILAAEDMISDEADKTFSGYYWDTTNVTEGTNEKLYDAINLATSDISAATYIYNPSDAKERVVATIEKQEFTTIQKAVDTAQNGEIVKLVVGEEDNSGSIVNEAVTISEEKNVTIDLNSKKWNSGNSKLNALTIDSNSTIKIVGEGTLSNIDYKEGSLELDSTAVINTISLGTGKTIKAGSEFGLTKEVSIELSKEDIEKLKTEDVILIEATNEVSEDVIKNISLADADPLVVIQKDENGNVVAHTLTGVFLNGESGDDSNDGKTLETAVKTFAKAKEIITAEDDAIFVTGTVTVDGTEEWSSLPEGVEVLRYGKFVDEIANVTGTLTVKDITIDGQSEKVIATEALIKVAEGGTLNIEDNAVLTNNSNTKSSGAYYVSGGAVYSNGKVNMTGGEISGNTSLYGAGIELWGEKSSMVLDGGTIKNNSSADLSSSTTGAGAGIAAMQGATLTMNGGEISNNKSTGGRGIGGGILVGIVIANDNSIGSTFVMNGGKISENTAKVDGGGIYVQCMSTATLNAGEITNNVCSGSNILGAAEGVYGGGGIYVNGGRTGYEDGKLIIPNAYISGNTNVNGDEGAAIAGCGTSTVYVYAESATIYNNEGKSEIYVDSTMRTGYGNTAKIDISKYAVGGGDNHWTDGEKELTTKQLKTLEPETILMINNPDAEDLDKTGEKSPVKITGNTSATRGAGIGTNGYVQIGEDETIYTEIKVTKTWEDNNDEHGLRPDSITVNLLANGEEVEEKEITEADNWEYTFTDLEKYDENDEKIEYTITEDEVDEYKTEIDGYDITNICTKEADSANREDEDDKIDEEDKTGEEDKKDEEQITEENEPKNPDNGEGSISTGDNIAMNCIALVVATIVLIKTAKHKRHIPKHRK